MVKSVATFDGFFTWQKNFRRRSKKADDGGCQSEGGESDSQHRRCDHFMGNHSQEARGGVQREAVEKLLVALVTSMMPSVMQYFVYTNVDDSSKYSHRLLTRDHDVPMYVGELCSTSCTQEHTFAEDDGTMQRFKRWDRARSSSMWRVGVFGPRLRHQPKKHPRGRAMTLTEEDQGQQQGRRQHVKTTETKVPRVVYYNVTSEHDSTSKLLKFWF